MTIGDIYFLLARDGLAIGIFDLYGPLQKLRRRGLITYAPLTAAEMAKARRQNPDYDALLNDRDDIRDYLLDVARYVVTTNRPCKSLSPYRDE